MTSHPSPFRLVQRLVAKSKNEQKEVPRFGDFFALDYMGAAEFEFGSFPAFLREAHKASKPVHRSMIDRLLSRPIKPTDWKSFEAEVKGIRIYGGFDSRLNSEQEVIDKIETIASGQARLKCSADFPPKSGSKTVGWAEVQQRVFWSTEDYRAILPELLAESVRTMDQQATSMSNP